MPSQQINTSDPIDAVITWVDGSAPDHLAQRRAFMAKADAPLHENAVNPHRWGTSDEILYCLRSIEHHAPWLRTIWIVVATDGPDLSGLSDAVRAKVRLVRHVEIFEGFEGALPTFNSLAIESVLWRIDGLSERFVYFNDDVFLTNALRPEDMFDGAKPVLRGGWEDYRHVVGNPALRADPAVFHTFVQINAARLAGFGAERLFAPAHVVHPMRRSILAELAQLHGAELRNNLQHRFRDLSQYLPQGLHNHACIAADIAVLRDGSDHVHITSGQGVGGDLEIVRAHLKAAAKPENRFLCVNDLPQLEALLPDARKLIEAAVAVKAGPITPSS